MLRFTCRMPLWGRATIGVSLIRPYSCNTRILPYPVVSCRILPYPAVSCRILPYPAVPCRILPYPAVSCHICHILPYPAFPAVSCRMPVTETLIKTEYWDRAGGVVPMPLYVIGWRKFHGGLQLGSGDGD